VLINMGKIILIIIFILQVFSSFAQGVRIKYALYNQNNQLIDSTKILFSDSVNFRIDWLSDERPYSLIILHNDTFITLFRNNKVYFVKRDNEIKNIKDKTKIIYTNRDSVIWGHKVSYAQVFVATNNNARKKEYEIWFIPNKDFSKINAGTPFSDIPGLIILKKDKEKHLTEKVISICKMDLPLDLFTIPEGYKKFEGNL